VENQTGWPDQLYEVLKRAEVRQVGYVPDAGHARLIQRCKADNDISDVVLSTEEEGVALAAGAWLGGQRAALLMQSSGVGNCINMLSLINTCRFPFLTLSRCAASGPSSIRGRCRCRRRPSRYSPRSA